MVKTKATKLAKKVLLRLVTIIYGKVFEAMYSIFSKTNKVMPYHESWR